MVVAGRFEQRSWETDDGERRSRVELVAEDVGPSLRFATAELTRTERRTVPASDGNGGEGEEGGEDQVSLDADSDASADQPSCEIPVGAKA